MVELVRGLITTVMIGALGACGATRTADGTQTVPAPATPVQKATASPENPDSAILADFNKRLDHYVKVQRAQARGIEHEETEKSAEITINQEILATKIRAVRKNARQGDIFTPQVADLLKRLMYPEVKGPDRKETKQALSEEDGEFAQVWLRVNARWPDSEPLTTVPPNLLANLPQLPEDVEYRIANKRHLVLRDVDANLIVDFIYNAIR